MLEEVSRHAMFQEIHRTIEESATRTAHALLVGYPDLTYPPNAGLLPDEIAALKSIPKSASMESALRKLFADAASHPVFHLMCLADGVADAPEFNGTEDRDDSLMLHDAFFESYWAWRKRRPDPGWKLDTYES
jgi:hypothetical protein